MTDPVSMLESLVDATQALAQPSDVQEKLLPSFVVPTDDLAQSFSDAYLLLDQIRNAGLVDAVQHEALDRIEKMLEGMTRQRDESVWSIEGLRNGDEWQRLRLAAKSALESMGRALRPPTYPGVTYVRSRKP